MKKIKALAIIACMAVIGFALAACRNPVDIGGDPGAQPGTRPSYPEDPKVIVMHISDATEWDYLVVGEGGRPMVFNVDEDTGMPTELYLQPEKGSDVGILFLFKEDGRPDAMIANGYMLYFYNYDEYCFDMMVMAPNGDVEYHYGIETDTDWGAFPAMSMLYRGSAAGARYLYEDKDALDWTLYGLDKAITVTTCIAAIFCPPMIVGCVINCIATVVEFTVDVLEYNDLLSDDEAFGLGYAADTATFILDGVGCATAVFNLAGVLDCVSTFTGFASLEKAGYDKEQAERLKAQAALAEKALDVLYPVVNFNANGGEGKVPEDIRVEKGAFVEMPPLGDLVKTGWTFLGWYTTPNPNLNYDRPTYTGNLIYDINRNTTLYAIWEDPTAPPRLPAWVSAEAVSPYRVRVSWRPVSGVFYYHVYRREGGGNSPYPYIGFTEAVERTITGNTYYTDTELSADTTYLYLVTAQNQYGESVHPINRFDPALATVVTPRDDAGIDRVPTGVTATAESETSITVSWDSFSGAMFYYVHRSTSAYDNYEQVGTVYNAADTSFTDTGLSRDTTYYYAVSAFGSSIGETGKSAFAYAKTLWQYDGVSGSAGLSYYAIGTTAYGVQRGSASGDIVVPAYYRPDANSPYLPVTTIAQVILGGSYISAGGAFGGYEYMNEPNTSTTSVTFAEDSPITYIGHYSFYMCTNMTSITLPAGLTTIYFGAFSGCTSLTSINIPSRVALIERNGAGDNYRRSPFENCTSLTEITVDPANTTYSSQDGILYNKEKTTLLKAPIAGTTGAVTIPAGVRNIDTLAFQDCTGLTSVTIPASVVYIGDYAFYFCRNLTSVTFEGTGISYSLSEPIPFGGDLREKHRDGGIGTYTRPNGSMWWTKQ